MSTGSSGLETDLLSRYFGLVFGQLINGALAMSSVGKSTIVSPLLVIITCFVSVTFPITEYCKLYLSKHFEIVSRLSGFIMNNILSCDSEIRISYGSIPDSRK